MSQNKKNGFTIVEILVVAPIIVLAIGAFITVVVNLTGQVLASRESNNIVYNIQDALNRIEQDVKVSNSFLAKNNITPLVSPQGYNDDTTNFTNISASLPNALILEQYAIANNPKSTNRSLIYLNTPNACNSAQLTQNQPMKINIIYFVKNNTLWRRTVMPSNYKTAGCDANTPSISPVIPWQQPSCEPSRTDSICESKDVKLVDGIPNTASFNMKYYDNPDSTTENTVVTTDLNETTRSTAFQSIKSVKITISSTKNIAGKEVSQSGVLRATIPSAN